MEKVVFDHSLKDIPIPNFYQFLTVLLDRTTDFIKRIRRKTYHFTRGNNKNDEFNNYGFKSLKKPPTNKHLIRFEEDLLDLVRKVRFKNRNCHFQKKLQAEIRDINRSNKIYVKADKSRNVYKINPSEYMDLKLESQLVIY